MLAVSYLNLTLDPSRGQSWLRYAMPWLVPAFGFLMVSRIPYVHVANRLFSGRKKFRFLVAGLFVAAAALAAPQYVLPAGMAAYIASGPVEWVRRRLNKPKDAAPPAPDTEGEEDLL